LIDDVSEAEREWAWVVGVSGLGPMGRVVAGECWVVMATVIHGNGRGNA
jgi:hypothetical protein